MFPYMFGLGLNLYFHFYSVLGSLWPVVMVSLKRILEWLRQRSRQLSWQSTGLARSEGPGLDSGLIQMKGKLSYGLDV